MRGLFQIAPGDTGVDKQLMWYNEWATAWLAELLGRDITYASRTQYYKGTGTQKLLLRNRPVYVTPSGSYSPLTVIFDPNGAFGSSSGAFVPNTTGTVYTYGSDYCLQIDQDDGSSRSGILLRLGGYWERPTARQPGLLAPFVREDNGSYKVIYTAGYTLDTLPGELRMAANMLVARLNYYFPLGLDLSGDTWDGKSINALGDAKNYVLSPTIKSVITAHRNWKF